MSYYSGTATSLTALRDALLTHAQADGWVLTGNVLSKAGVYFNIGLTTLNITCLGCVDNAGSSPAPGVVSIGRVWSATGYPTCEISFPCNYEVFGFAQELYFVVNYDTDNYQWMAFGKSTVQGLSGQGGWCGATTKEAMVGSGGNIGPIYITPTGGGRGYWEETAGALFWATLLTNSAAKNCWVNHGLDGLGWNYSTTNYYPIGIRHNNLLTMQPSVWNGEAVLLPLQCFIERGAYKSSLVADLEHARHIRIDNLTAGSILTLGSDKWKVFPWLKKDATARDGGLSVRHTGTFGWAVRYEGP